MAPWEEIKDVKIFTALGDWENIFMQCWEESAYIVEINPDYGKSILLPPYKKLIEAIEEVRRLKGLV